LPARQLTEITYATFVSRDLQAARLVGTSN
jgi:hypothetical protein